MKSNVFTALRFIAALLTVAAILGKPYLPPERLVIYPGPTTSAHIYGAVNGEGREDYGWLDQDSNSWWCHHKMARSEEHTAELQSRENLVCRLLLEKKK